MTREEFARILEDLLVVYDCELRPGRASLYFEDLRTFSSSVAEQAARDLRRTCKRFPALAEWVERCKIVAARRAIRSSTAESKSSGPSVPPSWETTANIALVKAAARGLRVGDSATRERALELARVELTELREEHNGPSDAPRALLTAEIERIARVLVRELAGDAAGQTRTPDAMERA